MANVPDTDSFSFLDVKNAVVTSPNNLVSAFADANDQFFDPRYMGNKDDLLNFRNYGGKSWFIERNDKILYLDDPICDHSINYYSTYGGEVPDSKTISPVYCAVNNSLNLVYGPSYGQNLYLNNALAVINDNYSWIYSWRYVLDLLSYSGTKIGTFYWRWPYSDYTNLKLKNLVTDFYQGDYMYFRFEVREKISPTLIQLDESAHLNQAVSTQIEGAFTVTIQQGSSWLSLDQTSGSNQSGFTFDVDHNFGGDYREGIIKVSSTTGNYYVYVQQYGGGAPV